MPSAVTAIFGADSTPLQAEMRRVETMAAMSGRRVVSNMAGEARSGFAGIVREMTVIGREIAMGRGSGRIAASFTLLFQYLRTLATSARNAAGPAKMVAEAYEEAAFRTSQAAVAAMRKAQASEAAFMADAEESEATLNAAIADRAKAASADQTAIATQQKAIAAREAAAAEEAEAVATAGASGAAATLTISVAALALVAGAVYEYFWGYKKALKEADMAIPDIKGNDYIPILKRHISDASNLQKEITDEVNRTTRAYESAAEAAKRTSDTTREHYSHLRKMLEVQKETQMAYAHSAAGKEVIEKKFAAQELQLQKDEHKEQINNLANEKAALDKERRTRTESAAKIKVATKEEDEKTLRELNANAEAAEAYLKGGSVWAEFKKQAAADLAGEVGGPSTEERKAAIEAAESGGMDRANAMIAERNKFSDKVAANDELRKQKKQFEDEAREDAKRAQDIKLSLPDIQKKFQQQETDAAAESAAEIAMEHARNVNRHERNEHLNTLQRIGAYTTTPPDFRKQIDLLSAIKHNTDHLSPTANRPVGRVPTQWGPLHS